MNEFIGLVSPQGRLSKVVKEKKHVFVADVIQYATEAQSLVGLKVVSTVFV